jgi:hypothetical protein
LWYEARPSLVWGHGEVRSKALSFEKKMHKASLIKHISLNYITLICDISYNIQSMESINAK